MAAGGTRALRAMRACAGRRTRRLEEEAGGFLRRHIVRALRRRRRSLRQRGWKILCRSRTHVPPPARRSLPRPRSMVLRAGKAASCSTGCSALEATGAPLVLPPGGYRAARQVRSARDHHRRDGVFENQLLLIVGFQHDRILIERPDPPRELHSAEQIDRDNGFVFARSVEKRILNILCRFVIHCLFPPDLPTKRHQLRTCCPTSLARKILQAHDISTQSHKRTKPRVTIRRRKRNFNEICHDAWDKVASAAETPAAALRLGRDLFHIFGQSHGNVTVFVRFAVAGACRRN